MEDKINAIAKAAGQVDTALIDIQKEADKLIRDRRVHIAVLEKVEEFLDDIHDGAPDAGYAAHRAARLLTDVRQALGKE